MAIIPHAIGTSLYAERQPANRSVTATARTAVAIGGSMNKEGGTWIGYTPLRSPRHPLLGRCGNRGPRSLCTQQDEKKKFAAKSTAKSRPNGNLKPEKLCLLSHPAWASRCK